MNKFEINELEEMFKCRCTQWYNKLLRYRRDGHYNGFSKIVSQCFKNHKKIEDLDDLREMVMDIDEYYWYDDTSLHYYTKYDEEYFDI